VRNEGRGEEWEEGRRGFLVVKRRGEGGESFISAIFSVAALLLAAWRIRRGGLDVDDLPAGPGRGAVAGAATLGQLLLGHDPIDFWSGEKMKSNEYVS